MKKVQTKTWRDYKLTDLFELVLPVGDIQAQKANEGMFPLISSGKKNNGVCKYIEKTSESNIIPGNSLTIDMFGKVFFHDNEYYAVSHGRVNILIPKFKMNTYIGLYLACVIETVTRPKYAFLDMCSQKALKSEIIKLPSNKGGDPDWKYIEFCMKTIMARAGRNINNLNKINTHIHKCDTRLWKDFSIGGKDGLFNIVKGTRLTKQNMKDGDINFIGSSAVNNGVTHHISNNEHIHPAHLITVSYNGSVGEAFYQEKPFWASDDVNVFYPKFKQNFEVAMFLIPLIRKVGLKYKFADKWKLEDMCNDKIKLPITPKGQPDWEYMESYMKEIFQKAEHKMSALNGIVK